MTLRDDEEFVMQALATKYSGAWEPGENPPDAYLAIGCQTISVEISTLTQHILDDDKGFIPRLSQDSSAINLIEELNDELSANIPSGLTVLVHVKAPVKNKRKLKPLLATSLIGLLAKSTTGNWFCQQPKIES